jgi:hypothetical protein
LTIGAGGRRFRWVSLVVGHGRDVAVELGGRGQSAPAVVVYRWVNLVVGKGVTWLSSWGILDHWRRRSSFSMGEFGGGAWALRGCRAGWSWPIGARLLLLAVVVLGDGVAVTWWSTGCGGVVIDGRWWRGDRRAVWALTS